MRGCLMTGLVSIMVVAFPEALSGQTPSDSEWSGWVRLMYEHEFREARAAFLAHAEQVTPKERQESLTLAAYCLMFDGQPESALGEFQDCSGVLGC